MAGGCSTFAEFCLDSPITGRGPIGCGGTPAPCTARSLGAEGAREEGAELGGLLEGSCELGAPAPLDEILAGAACLSES